MTTLLELVQPNLAQPVNIRNIDGVRTVIVRTGDFGSYRYCRRAWNWSSAIRGGRRKPEQALPLWTGTGFHFALEDYHGHNKYGGLENAWTAYVEATRKLARVTKSRKRATHIPLPDNWEDDDELARGMLQYYELWLKDRDPLKTYWVDGKPQVEMRFYVELDWSEGHLGIDRVLHQFTIDRVIVDDDNYLWPKDYKTAARYEDLHLVNDSQVTSYCWGLSALYGATVAGFIYQQHIKTVPQPPTILSKGLISSNKSQNTTSLLYIQALENVYGSVSKAPESNQRCLDHLMGQEGEERDKYIKRDRVERSMQSLYMHEQHMMMQLEEMLDPSTKIYPSPNRSCSYCGFQLPCLAYDDGDDWKQLLETSTMKQDEQEEMHQWRQYLPKP